MPSKSSSASPIRSARPQPRQVRWHGDRLVARIHLRTVFRTPRWAAPVFSKDSDSTPSRDRRNRIQHLEDLVGGRGPSAPAKARRMAPRGLVTRRPADRGLHRPLEQKLITLSHDCLAKRFDPVTNTSMMHQKTMAETLENGREREHAVYRYLGEKPLATQGFWQPLSPSPSASPNSPLPTRSRATNTSSSRRHPGRPPLSHHRQGHPAGQRLEGDIIRIGQILSSPPDCLS